MPMRVGMEINITETTGPHAGAFRYFTVTITDAGMRDAYYFNATEVDGNILVAELDGLIDDPHLGVYTDVRDEPQVAYDSAHHVVQTAVQLAALRAHELRRAAHPLWYRHSH
jgi:hypothetical protein